MNDNVVFVKDEHGVFAVFLNPFNCDENGEFRMKVYDEDGVYTSPLDYCKGCEEVEDSREYNHLIEFLNDEGYVVNVVSKSLLEKI